MARRRAAAALLLGLGAGAACVVDLRTPTGVEIACPTGVCPAGLSCDAESGVCVDPTAPPPRPVLRVTPSEGGRSTVFAFDATGTVAPDEGGALSFAWELHDPRYDGDADPSDFDLDTGVVGTLATTLPATRDMVCPGLDAAAPCTGFIARTVQVRVTAENGVSRSASIVVVVRNQAPHVDAGEDLFIGTRRVDSVELDACGGGASCTTTDPDGDPVDGFVWTQVAGPAVVLVAVAGSEGRRVSFTPPSLRRPQVFRVTASDGFAEASDEVTVYQESQVWLGTADPVRLNRLYAGSHSVSYDLNGYHRFVGALAAGADRDLWIGVSTGDVTTGPGPAHVVRASPDFVEIERWSFDDPNPTAPRNVDIPEYDFEGYFDGIVGVAPTGHSACVALKNLPASVDVDDEPVGGFGRVSGASVTHVLATEGVGTSANLVVGVHAIDLAAPSCWTVRTQAVGLLSDAEGWVERAPQFENVISAAVHPDGALWVSDTPGIPWVPPFVSTLYRCEVAGPCAEVALLAGRVTAMAPAADGMYAHDDGSLMTEDDQRIVHVGLDGVVSDLQAPPGVDVRTHRWSSLATDPTDGALWGLDSTSGTLYRFDVADAAVLDHRTLSSEAAGVSLRGSLLDVDAETGAAYLYSEIQGGVQRSFLRVAPHLRWRDTVATDLRYTGLLTAETARGTAWVHRAYPAGRGLVRIAASGRKLVDLPDVEATDVLALADGGVLAARSDDGGLVLVRYAPTGVEVGVPRAFAAPVLGAALAGDVLCVIHTGASTCGPGGTSPCPYAARYATLASDALAEEVLDTGDYLPAVVAAAPSGACWFGAYHKDDEPGGCVPGFGGVCGDNQTHVFRFALGAAQPDVSPNLDETRMLALVVDPVDEAAVWVAHYDYGNSRVVRVGPLTEGGPLADDPCANLSTSSNLTDLEVFACDGGAPDCRVLHLVTQFAHVRAGRPAVPPPADAALCPLRIDSVFTPPIGQPSGGAIGE